jgi:hypothetical protein
VSRCDLHLNDTGGIKRIGLYKVYEKTKVTLRSVYSSKFSIFLKPSVQEMKTAERQVGRREENNIRAESREKRAYLCSERT